MSAQRDAFVTAASDTSGRQARRRLASALAEALCDAGDRLRVHGHIFGDGRVDGSSVFGNGDDRTVGLGYVSSTAGVLVHGSRTLLDSGNHYSGAALIRQLVEAEYLAWAFAEDTNEAAAWLSATPAQRKTAWQPRHLRDRSGGRFRGLDYSWHCELGGHPTPPGMRALLARSEAVLESQWYELSLHAESTWRYVCAGTAGLASGPLAVSGDLAAEETWTEAREASEAWHRDDGLRAVSRELRAEGWLG